MSSAKRCAECRSGRVPKSIRKAAGLLLPDVLVCGHCRVWLSKASLAAITHRATRCPSFAEQEREARRAEREADRKRRAIYGDNPQPIVKLRKR